MQSINVSRIWLCFSLAAAALLLLAGGCFQKDGGQPANSPGADPSPITLVAPNSTQTAVSAPPEFVGNAACANCHAVEFKDHQTTHHASTMRFANTASLGEFAPKPGRLPNTEARVQQEGERFQVVSSAPNPVVGPLHYGIGSGKSGITFVTVMGSHLFEMRATYFPRLAKWKVTPGQERIKSAALGVDHPGSEARRCLLCHVTTLPPDSNVPEPTFFGVGCESCHGPASKHVAGMQGGKVADSHMERLESADGRRINELCGTCHRSAIEADPPPGRAPDLTFTSRFQSYALMLSRCFKESNGALSCITCHNPHKNASMNIKSYEVVCLTCHGPAAGAPSGRTTRVEAQSATASHLAAHGKTCPVNSRSGCIGCHMPSKRMLPNDADSIVSADHFIRVARPKLEAQWLLEWKHNKK